MTSPIFRAPLRKGDKTKLRIVEAATRLIARKGLHNLTYEEVAQAAKSTRQLVQTYYPDRDCLFEECIKLGRLQFQEHVIHAMEKVAPRDRLNAYIDSTFAWVRDNPEQCAIIIFFHHLCVTDGKKKSLNTDHTDIGTKRIETILAGALSQKLPRIRSRNLAKTIQNIIMGHLYCFNTESRDYSYIRSLAKNAIRTLIHEAIT